MTRGTENGRPMGSEYCELDRQFRPPTNTDGEAAAWASYAQDEGASKLYSWTDLLHRKIVVVLGEAGSGKSWEFRRQADKLLHQGQVSFFIRLDALVDQSVERLVNPEELDRFLAWVRGKGQAFFFLDSIDESKYRKVSDFELALKTFRVAIPMEALARATYLLSGRISDWRWISDLELVRRELGVRREFRIEQDPSDNSGHRVLEGKSDEDEPLVVEISALDRSRVQTFAAARAEPNVSAFIQAIDDRLAWAFARRPLDVDDLLGFWRANGRLGTTTELVTSSLARNLKETHERHRQSELTPDRARQGVRFLGAATAFCRRFNFIVPDDQAWKAGDALDTAECLPGDWTDSERQALLNRAVFDGASYGRVRFHHRRVAEYLAAEWLSERIREGCAGHVLDELLFARSGSRRVLRPSMAPIAAWLACGTEQLNATVRAWLLEAAPGVSYLLHGDSRGLPLDFKQQLLECLVTYFQGRERIWLNLDSSTMAALADPGLADRINALVSDSTVPIGLRQDFLRIAWHGRLRGCVGAAIQLLNDLSADHGLRTYASCVVRDVADGPDRLRVARGLTALASIESDIGSHLAEALYPEYLDNQGLVSLLSKMTDVDQKSTSSSTYYLEYQLERHAPLATAADLLERLVTLGRTPPTLIHNKKPTELSKRYSWVARVIDTVLVRLLGKGTLDPEEIKMAAKAIHFLDEYHEQVDGYRANNKDLAELVARHDELRRHCIWGYIESWRAVKGKEPDYPFELDAYWRSIRLGPQDLKWLIEDIRGRPALNDRLVAIKFSWNLVRGSEQVWRDRWQIGWAATKDRIVFRQLRSLVYSTPRFWVNRMWYGRLRHTIADRFWWQRRFLHLQNAYREVTGRVRIYRNLKLLRSGQAIGWLSHFASETSGTFSKNKYAPDNWDRVRKLWGAPVARAVQQGCMVFWKEHMPDLPHEKDNPNSTTIGTIVGLAGVSIAITSGALNLDAMTSDEVRRTVRYAVNEINGFPEWLPRLAAKHPADVQAVLQECVTGEWKIEAGREQCYEVLHDLVYHGQGMEKLVKAGVLELIRGADPINTKILEQALSLLIQGEGNVAAELGAVAAQRLPTHSPDSERFGFWMAVWLQCDALPAVAYLEKVLSERTDAKEVMVKLCADLRGRRGDPAPRAAAPSFLEGSSLRKFVPLVFRYLKTADDIDRAGQGVYSPGPRDAAQDFRQYLLEQLAQGGDDREAILRELINHPDAADYKDWLLHTLDRYIEAHSDLPEWSPQDVISFAKDYETDPKTDRELFRIAMRRVEEVRREVETGNLGWRDEIAPGADERRVRVWLGGKLHQLARGRYTIPQEVEIALKQRPDLRFEHPKVSYTSVELKWMDNWNLKKLMLGLEGQLAGDYLRGTDSRFGLYILAHRGDVNSWTAEGGENLNADQVVAQLEHKAEEIVSKSPHIADIRIVKISLVPPLTHRKAASAADSRS